VSFEKYGLCPQNCQVSARIFRKGMQKEDSRQATGYRLPVTV
jgi:hypothetical protein